MTGYRGINATGNPGWPGWFKAFFPTSVLTGWGITDPATQFTGYLDGTQVSSTVTAVTGGYTLEFNFQFASTKQLEAGTPPSAAGPSGPSLDFSGSATTDENGYYDINGFRGFVFHDQGEHVASGGNHYGAMPFDITSEGYQVCITVPGDYEATGVSVNQSEFIAGASCYENKYGARVDFGIAHVNSTANHAGASTTDDGSALAVAGIPVGSAGGGFECLGARVTVPANVVPDGTRFLCSADTNAQTGVAPTGFGLLGAKVSLATDSGQTQFSAPLTVCFTHRAGDILKAGGDAANLRVGFFDGVLAQWQPLPVAAGGENESCGLADHFTQFGLMAATPTALPATGAGVAPVVTWAIVVLALVLVAGWGFSTQRRGDARLQREP